MSDNLTSVEADAILKTFQKFDENGDGFINESEMAFYLLNLFTAVFVISPQTRSSLGGISASSLARVTTTQAFSEATLNEDGLMSLDAFSV